MLNHLLSGAWEEYATGLQKGSVVELEAKYKRLVAEIVSDVVRERELPSVGLEGS